MKLLPCAVLALSCIGVAASGPAFSGEHAMPDEMGMRIGPMPGPRPHGRGSELQLSEAQEQKAFALRHAFEPLRVEQTAALRKAHEGLRALAASGQFDEAKAAALSQAIGKAAAALALGQARTDAQFLALLTPEQRARLDGDAPRSPMPPRP
jgi:Spy/CpxP family protein refolding chaperone